LWLKYNKPKLERPFNVWWGLTVIFMLSAIFIIIGNGMELTPQNNDPSIINCRPDAIRIPNYIKSVISIGFIVSGFICWYIRYYEKSIDNQ